MLRQKIVSQYMVKKGFILVVLLLVLGPVNKILYAQELGSLNDSMKIIAPLIRNAPTDPERYFVNDLFIKLLDEALSIDWKMHHVWQEMEGVSILTSPDKRCRIFTWFIPLSSGNYVYQGVIQSYNERQKRYTAHWLVDQSEKITQPEHALLDANNWFGALYYELIPVSTSSNTYYTLLGWDGHDNLSRRKLIEILSFRSNGIPVFGYHLFRQKNQKNRRIIFEYSAKTSMALRYDRQAYTERFRKKGKGIVEKQHFEEMIVFDRLMPMHPSMEGQFAFYVPETNIVDGYIFQNGRWNFIPNIDARNPAPKKRKPITNPSGFQLFPPKQ